MVIKERLNEVYVDIIVEIGNIDIKVKDVLSLKTGDYIRLDKVKISDNYKIKIEDKVKFECRPGVVSKRMAVQIVKVFDTNIVKTESNEGGKEE